MIILKDVLKRQNGRAVLKTCTKLDNMHNKKCPGYSLEHFYQILYETAYLLGALVKSLESIPNNHYFIRDSASISLT